MKTEQQAKWFKELEQEVTRRDAFTKARYFCAWDIQRI